MDICTRGTTSFGNPLEKDPVEDSGQESLSRARPEATENVPESGEDHSLKTVQRANLHVKIKRLLETSKISEKEAGTSTSAEDERAHEPAAVKSCSLVTASRELLTKKDPANGVAAEKPRFHIPDEEPMEEIQENLSKLPPNAKENLADKPAVKICTRDTASSNMPFKKDPLESECQEHWSKPLLNEPDDGAVVTNEELARLKLYVPSRIGSIQINELDSTR